MPHGKPAGVRCVQLLDDLRCGLWGSPDRPAVCESLRPSPAMCASSAAEALEYLRNLELLTRPDEPLPDAA